MSGGHRNRDDPDLPKLRRFRLGPDGSTMTPVPVSGAAHHDDDDVVGNDFDEVSDQFDEGDLTESRTTQFPTMGPSRNGPGPMPMSSGSMPPVRSATGQPGPNSAYPARGTAPARDQPSNTVAPEAPAPAGKKRALWAVGTAAVVVLLAAFVLIAKPFSDDAPAPQDTGVTNSSRSEPANRDSGSAQTSPTAPNGVTPDRLPPTTGGLPAPGSPRPADPNKWATTVCGAISTYEQTSASFSQTIDQLGTSPVANAKMVTIASQSSTLLTDLRTGLADITEGGDNGKLSDIQNAVATAADDAATGIDPARSDNKGQSIGTYGDKVKEALAQPKSTLKSEVAKLDKGIRNTVKETAACKPLDL